MTDKSRPSAPAPRANLARDFGERVARLRHDIGLSETELAERSGLANIKRLEHGVMQPRLGDVLRLCEGLKVSPNVLLRGMYREGR